MSWPSFVVGYALCAAFTVLIHRALFRGRWGRLGRCILAALSLAFFVDYSGEDRSLWRFTQPSPFRVLDVPLENLLFVVASVPFIILIHSWAKVRFRRPNAR